MSEQNDDTISRPMPIWLSLPIILLCLFSGGWIIHWYVMTDPISHDSMILGDPAAPTNWQLPGRGRGPNNPKRYVQEQGGGAWEVQTNKCHAELIAANGKVTLRAIKYLAYQFVPDDVKNTIYANQSLVADATRTTALMLSPQQIKKLRQLSAKITMVVTPKDRQELADALNAYIAARPTARPALEPKILQTLDDIADRSMAATKQQAIDRVKQINAIITPQMWQQNAAMGGAK